MHAHRMKALGLIGNSRLGPVQADGSGRVSRGLGVGNLAGEYDAALYGLGQHCLARLRMLIPAKRLARQKRISEPFECDKRVPATLGLGSRGTHFFYASVKIGR